VKDPGTEAALEAGLVSSLPYAKTSVSETVPADAGFDHLETSEAVSNDFH